MARLQSPNGGAVTVSDKKVASLLAMGFKAKPKKEPAKKVGSCQQYQQVTRGGEPVSIIVKTDLPTAIQSAELVDLMVSGANARAARVAPCLVSDDPTPTADQINEAKLVLVGAVKRWAEAGAGAFQSQTAGPFGVTVDTRQRGGFNLWPSEITDLQAICADGDTGREAFSIDTAQGLESAHLAWCSLAFGATYCSCGVDIAGEPIYELG